MCVRARVRVSARAYVCIRVRVRACVSVCVCTYMDGERERERERERGVRTSFSPKRGRVSFFYYYGHFVDAWRASVCFSCRSGTRNAVFVVFIRFLWM